MSLTGKTTVHLEVPASIVWEALTNPQKIKKYFFGTDTESTWKKGEPITFSGEWEGKKYQDKGTILNIEPNKQLKYNYWSSMSGKEDIPENYANVTYDLEEKDGQTTLTITQDGIANEEAKKHSEQNWGMVLEGLKQMLEK